MSIYCDENDSKVDTVTDELFSFIVRSDKTKAWRQDETVAGDGANTNKSGTEARRVHH